MKKRLVWFRDDLRSHDNETLRAALDGAFSSLSFVHVEDERFDLPTPEGYPARGAFNGRFRAECVADLDARLRALHGPLIRLRGNPRELIPKFCRDFEIDDLYLSHQYAYGGRDDQIAIERELRATGVSTYAFHTRTLVHPGDLPRFDFGRRWGFSKFRAAVEKSWPVRPVEGEPGRPPEVAPELPPARRGIHLTGGEGAALSRLHAFVWAADGLATYKQTRNGLIALDDSSKFSAALAAGALSPRYVYSEVRRYERERGRNASTLWFLFELLWRDHFQFSALRRGSPLFTDPAPGRPDMARGGYQKSSFEAWRAGRTQNGFINAAMNELRLTGWLSNRMRQLAASYLVHDLGVDWRAGARWFESCLVDYDPGSNWGNWAYVAGAGPGETPHAFDIDQQRRAYDRDDRYQDLWSHRGGSQ